MPLATTMAVPDMWFTKSTETPTVMAGLAATPVGAHRSRFRLVPCSHYITVAPIQDTPLILQPVAEDGFTSTGASTTLLHLNDSTDSGVIEAPALAKYGNTYVLFFSSGCFMTDSYTVNYATAPAITGPYIRAASPLFQTGTDGLQAPGGMDVDVDNTHMVFHANYGSNTRPLFTAQISFNDNVISA